MEPLCEDFLTKEEENALLRLSRATLDTFVKTGERTRIEELTASESMRELHGAFVTLRTADHSLRGCIGVTANTKPLVVAVRDSTVNSASADPRFRPVAESELDAIRIEISALTRGDKPGSPFRRISRIEEIEIGRDGLFIERAPNRGGLFLPQVAVEQNWDVGQFLAALCRKAGFKDRAWEDPNMVLYRFSAQVFGEPATSLLD